MDLCISCYLNVPKLTFKLVLSQVSHSSLCEQYQPCIEFLLLFRSPACSKLLHLSLIVSVFLAQVKTISAFSSCVTRHFRFILITSISIVLCDVWLHKSSSPNPALRLSLINPPRHRRNHRTASSSASEAAPNRWSHCSPLAPSRLYERWPCTLKHSRKSRYSQSTISIEI